MIYGVGSAVTIGVVVFVTILARNAIKKAMEEQKNQEARVQSDEKAPLLDEQPKTDV